MLDVLGSRRSWIVYASLLSGVLGLVYGPLAIGSPLPNQEAGRTKVADGEYAIYEHDSSGSSGPFPDQAYNFRESWTLWRVERGEYRIEGIRNFESPKDDSGSKQRSDSGQKFSDSLLIAPFSKRPEYLRYPDGRQQLIYANENEYPAEDVLSFLRKELKNRGWKPLTQDFFDPENPSSERSGWEFMEDQTHKPSKATWRWSAEWENGSQDITMYFLKYESPTNSPLDAKNLQVTALYIPAEIAAKMKRDGEKFKQDRNPKL